MLEALKKPARATLLGLTLAAMINGPLSRPARAQFGGVVHDPVTLAAHVRQWAEQLKEWLETVDYYARSIERMTEQVTNLKGILQMTERQLGFSKRMLQTISNIGQTIRAAYKIKTLLEGLVQGRLRYIARIHDRLAAGIFNPERDAQDLKDYLSWELGQISERTLGDIERLEGYDSTLQMLNLEIELRKKRIADAEESAKRSEEQLRQMRDNPESVTQIDIQHAQLEASQRDFEAQLARDREEMLKLQREALQRRERIARDTMESRRFGRQIDDLNKSWKNMTDALNKLRITPTGEDEDAQAAQ